MALRRSTEASARDLFIAAGGWPQRSVPHYFVLGASDWFASLYRDVAEVRLPVAALPAEVTSATYADSITAMGRGVPLGLPAPDPDHAGRVYRLDELEDLIAHYGLPNDTTPQGPGGYARSPAPARGRLHRGPALVGRTRQRPPHQQLTQAQPT